MPSISSSAGATKVPFAHSPESGVTCRQAPRSAISLTWACRPDAAASEMMGPMSVSSLAGLPTRSSSMAPAIMSMALPAMSS